MVVRDIVSFSRDNFYNGAIQTEWYYDTKKAGKIASSYVFHGPKYHGVSDKDVNAGAHKLIDTASFAQIISNKLHIKKPDNCFLLTIAGYGTGKSHLAVTLGTLFGGNKSESEVVFENIQSIDSQIAEKMRNESSDNFVIALNGMKNFNLDSEMLRCVRIVLEQHGLSDDFLKKLTKTYDVAKHFVKSSFDKNIEDFEKAALQNGITEKGQELKAFLLSHIETDKRSVEVVNIVFSLITGDSLHWDQGISAGEILNLVGTELCGEGKPFNKILLLFDEFGRYIEYVAANPLVAGDSSLQQVFEAVQNLEGKAIFVGFVQYELEAYLSHIDKEANVIRYVGRYSISEKYYLSSNFETILASLLSKAENGLFEKKIGQALTHYENYHGKVHSALERWTGGKSNKNVWSTQTLYRKVIMEGCYPLHPITVWLLSNSSRWMQQRSTIAFCAEMYDAVSEREIEGDWLPYIYPIDIVDSGIYSEMLNSEEKGLVKSQNCMLYNEICIKVGDKLSLEEQKILKAVLVAKIGNFSFYDKEEAYTAFRYLTNLTDDDIKSATKNLEDRHGVIAFDEQAKTYDLIAEANGFNEFKRVYVRYKTGRTAVIDDLDEEIQRSIGILDSIDTAFAQENHISSSEWKFEKRLVDSEEVDENYLNGLIRSAELANDGEAARGYLVYTYCGNGSEEEAERLSKVVKDVNIDDVPVIVLWLDDPDGEILKALTIKSTLSRFSVSDAERFAKFIGGQKRKQDKAIVQKFNELVMSRKQITSSGITSYETRLNALCTEKFKKVYRTPVPFAFDGFENSKVAQARKTFATICVKLFDHTLMNVQSYQALNSADKNRIQSCLAVGPKYSWQVFNSDCKLVLPQNEVLRKIYDAVEESIPDEGAFSVNRLFGHYLRAPYGMNMYAYTLFVVYFIQKHENKLVCFLGSEKLTAANLSNSILKDGKLKFSELQRVTIQRNLNADVDVIAELCKEILDNTDVEKCAALAKRLDDILRVEGGSEQNQIMVGQARMRLADGDRLKKKIDDRKEKMKQILDEANAKFVIHKFVSIFDYLGEPSGVMEEGLPFLYPASFVEEYQTAVKRVSYFLGDTFSKALMALRCSDITLLSSFQNTYTKVVKVLRDNGYSEQAAQAEERAAQIAEETRARNQYNQALGEFEKEYALFGSVDSLRYDECDDIIRKFSRWIAFFGDAQIPKSISQSLVEKANKVIETVSRRKSEIDSTVESVVEKVECAQDYQDLEKIESVIRDLLELNLDKISEDIMEKIQKQIVNLRARIESIPENVDILQEMIATIECNNIYERVFGEEVKSKRKVMIDSEQKWIDLNVVPIENANDMDVVQCSSSLEKIRKIPAYVSSSTIERAKKAEKKVTDCLHACKVQGVLSLYYALNAEEKEEFNRIILEGLNR